MNDVGTSSRSDSIGYRRFEACAVPLGLLVTTGLRATIKNPAIATGEKLNVA
jgi:hypothetical protein